MALILFVFLGGALTIVSPCILPVLPFVFARAEQPFLRNGLPMLGGMALTFAAVATLAAVGGAWAVHLNEYGRIVSLVVLALLALTLLSARLADRLAQPFVSLGNRLTQSSSAAPRNAAGTGIWQSALLGVATGLLWAPCAGPILGLVLTGAAISGPNARTTTLLFAYAVGAASSLALALLAGGRLFALMKRSLGAGVWIRRGLGVAVLIAVAVIAFGWDTGALTRLSLARTVHVEQALETRFNQQPVATATGAAKPGAGGLSDEGSFPSLEGATAWINSSPLTPAQLRGKVVLVDFWTYSCINCLRSLPHVKSWYDKYKDHGLVVIGVHSPEFAFERDLANVQHAVADLGVAYPVALDNGFGIWQMFHNRYWPAHYFIDAQGEIRGHHYGEGDYLASEQVIRQLLTDAGAKNLPAAANAVMSASGVQASADKKHERSPETYVGYARAERFSSPTGFVHDEAATYAVPTGLALNDWALDGQAPGADHGIDTDEQGYGRVGAQRLYQLIRQSANVREHEFSIQFQDDGVTVYAFTFG